MSGFRNTMSGAKDKRTQYWESIFKEKLDTLRWVMLHSGLNVAGLQDDDGRTGLQVAAAEGKPKALLVMLDLLRQKRELAEAIDVPNDDGMTPLMLAAAKGHATCVEHLHYYGASLKAKNADGLTAKDLAVKHKRKEVIDYFEEEEEVAKGGSSAAVAVEDAVGADGLTSTQRNRQKKKALRDSERKGVIAAAAAAGDGDDGEGGGSGGAGSTEDAAAASAAAAAGVPPLPTPAPAAVWPEVATAAAEKRREVTITKTAAPTAADAGAAAEVAIVGFAGDGDNVDPALWYCALLNRLELHVAGLRVLAPHIGHLKLLQTLILSGNSELTALPTAISALVELRFLDVSRCSLTALPDVFAPLTKLEVLDASQNKLTSLAPLAPLTSLTALKVDRNELTDLSPLAFGKLARLDTLTASHNKLTVLPDEVGLLASLSNLNVADNEITELPASMSELKEKKIKDMQLLPNPIADKKVLKVLSADRPEKVVKELFKYLAQHGTKPGGAGGKGGKGKKGKKGGARGGAGDDEEEED